MVKLNKIYTRSGDKGSTVLGDAARVSKADPRVEAYGDVDEANAAIGLAIAACDEGAEGGLRALLESVQNDLFDVGADLCAPISEGEKAGERLRVVPAQSARLERAIDRYNEGLAELSSFVLPGGTELSARLHVARTAVRRAERRVVRLLESEPTRTNGETLVYLNRLSDLFFVLARFANDRGAGDVLWKPGESREGA